jgi:hypothetical protein
MLILIDLRDGQKEGPPDGGGGPKVSRRQPAKGSAQIL